MNRNVRPGSVTRRRDFRRETSEAPALGKQKSGRRRKIGDAWSDPKSEIVSVGWGWRRGWPITRRTIATDSASRWSWSRRHPRVASEVVRARGRRAKLARGTERGIWVTGFRLGKGRRERRKGTYFGDDHWLSFLRRLKRNLLGKFPRRYPWNNNQLNFRKFTRRGGRVLYSTCLCRLPRSDASLARDPRWQVPRMLGPSVSPCTFFPLSSLLKLPTSIVVSLLLVGTLGRGRDAVQSSTAMYPSFSQDALSRRLVQTCLTRFAYLQITDESMRRGYSLRVSSPRLWWLILNNAGVSKLNETCWHLISHPWYMNISHFFLVSTFIRSSCSCAVIARVICIVICQWVSRLYKRGGS